MKAIVFGGAGFVGSHVADSLLEAGHEVVIFDNKKSPYLQAGQKMVIGDVLDQDTVNKLVKGADVIYNFAGVSDIDEAAANPLTTIQTNIIGNTIILEACRKEKIQRYVFASSLYVYSKSGSFYRSSKQSCELIIENYNEVFGIPYTILRYGSLYGPRADRRNAIYRFIKQALTDKKIMRHGDGDELREYIHVLDAAKGSITILSKEFENQNVILTGHQQVRIRDLLLMIKEMFDNKIEVEYLPVDEDYHYEITPYVFAPKIGKRLMGNTYLDLGQGILECVYNLSKELNCIPPHEDVGVMTGKGKDG